MKGLSRFFLKAASVLICAVILINSIPLVSLAYTEKTGYINGTGVRMRSGPGTENSVNGTFSLNQSVTVIGEGRDSSGDLWYNVKSTLGTGYVFAEYVTVTGTVQENSLVKEYDTPYAAKITDYAVNFRSKATTSASKYGQFDKGSPVTVIGEDSTSGKLWYHVRAVINGQEKTGYVFGDYVEKTVDYTYDGEFENYLNSQGFPESYKAGLRNLHALYPAWIFVADKINVKWSTMVEGETVPTRSLIQTSNDALKSNAKEVFDPASGQYVQYDSGGFVAASADIVKYYLDPRNFLNSNGIFQFFGHGYDSSITSKSALQSILNGTFMEGKFPETVENYDTYADVIMYAAQESGVSPYALAAQILIEQGVNGTGAQISGNYPNHENYYNYFSVNAYATGEISAAENGLIYAAGNGSYLRPWNTRFKSIVGGSIFYGKAYVSVGQNTYYYKKFDVVGDLFTHQYMTNIMGASIEADRFRRGFTNSMDSALIFHIPVYLDMPNEISPYPTGQGNNNFYLKELSVDGYQLNPTFETHKNVYDIIVDNDVSSVNINAVPYADSANVTGGGTKTLSYGENSFSITVTAQSGYKNTYTVNVFRSGTAPVQGEPTVTSSYITDAEYVYGISEGTDVNAFLSRFSVKNGTIGVVSGDTRKTSGVIASSDVLVIYNESGDAFNRFTLCVSGDINGDGKISIMDLSMVQKNILGIGSLNGAKSKFADINGDGRISIIDLSRIQKHILGIEKINQ